MHRGLTRAAGWLLILSCVAAVPGHLWADVRGRAPQPGSAGTSTQGRPCSLDELIAYALAHNHEVAAVGLDGEAAVARAEAARGARLPRLSIEGGYTLYGEDLRLTAARYNGEPGVFGDNIFSADLVLRLPLYAGGRLVSEMRAAELLQASADQRLSRSKGDLVFNVSSLYYGQLAQMRLIESLGVSAESLAGQLGRVNALIAGRKAAKVDALRTEVKLSDLRQRLLREQNTLAIQRQALLNLLGGEGPGGGFTLGGTLEPPAAESRSLETLTESALEKRPDARAARAELEAQGAKVEVARAAYRPTVNLVGAVGNRSMVNPTQQPRGLDNSDENWRVGITVEVPLFDGRTGARVAEEKAKLSAQRERLLKLQLQIRLEVETAYLNLASALERLAGTRKAIDLATESLRIEQEKYALARGTAQDVLDAQSGLLDAQTNQIRALADANTAAAQLALATGENLP